MFRLVGLVLVLAVIAVGAGYLWLRQTVPSWEGRYAAEAVSAPVTIVRDRDGVPHITGESDADVFFALGFAHAQDRLWQMELSRRAGQGRLSEIFGERTVAADIYLRTLDLYGHATRSIAFLEPETRRILDAYAAGVNAWIERPTGLFEPRLPPEFILLRHAPEPWTPADSLVIVKAMAIGLSKNVSSELLRYALATRFTPGEVEELVPPYPGDEPFALPDLADLYPLPREVDVSALPDLSRFEGASNNWVVSGARSVTGKPLLANDPHLGLTAPALWYLAHLTFPGGEDGPAGEAIGASLAGTPLIVLGRTDRVAWGFTNHGADVQDLFVEKVNPADPSQYLTPDGWRAFETDTVRISVRGGEDRLIERKRTRHGPVVPILDPDIARLAPEGHVFALAWTALDDDDRSMEAGLEAMRARNASGFVAAMAKFRAPPQNVVYADVEGAIGLVSTGLVPRRDPANAVRGRAPVPGWEAVYDWQGMIAPSAMPQAVNPPSGAIATANEKIVSPSFGAFLGHDWEAPWRAERLHALLNGRPIHSLEAFQSYQMDDLSLAMAHIVPLMIDAAAAGQPGDPRVADALARLRAWDGRMSAQAAEPLIAMAWLREAMSAVFADDLGSLSGLYQGPRVDALSLVLRDGAVRPWCDEAGTAVAETCADVLRSALARALDTLGETYGADPARWQWGVAHPAFSEHRPLGLVPYVGRFFNISVPSPGGPFTLNRGDLRFGSERPFANVHAASYRSVFDLADLDRSLHMQTSGQSGNPFSPHYDDLAARWAAGEYLPMTTDPAVYRPGALGVTVIAPPPP